MNRHVFGAIALLAVLHAAAGMPDAFAQNAAAPDSFQARLVSLGTQSALITGISVAEVSDQIAALNQLTGLEVSTAPTGTSTGGFSFTFDAPSGTFSRVTRTFGPVFAKRSLTSGRGRLSAGLNWLHASYDALGGFDLKNGELVTVRIDNALANDIASSPIRIDLSSDSAIGFINLGVTNDLDVGVVLPWVRVKMGADVRYLSATGTDLTPPGDLLTVPAEASSGIGDIGIFAKYRFWRRDEGGLAAEISMRLPTGDSDNFRGTGVTRTKFSGIWSTGGRIAPHAHIGYEFWSSEIPLSSNGDVSLHNQFEYSAGVELQPHPRLTVNIDALGRLQGGGGKLDYETLPVGPVVLELLLPTSDGLHSASIAPGVRWNVVGNLLFTGSVLTSISNNGLRANVVPLIGLELPF